MKKFFKYILFSLLLTFSFHISSMLNVNWAEEFEYYVKQHPELVEIFKLHGITKDNVSTILVAESENLPMTIVFSKSGKEYQKTFTQNVETEKYEDNGE